MRPQSTPNSSRLFSTRLAKRGSRWVIARNKAHATLRGGHGSSGGLGTRLLAEEDDDLETSGSHQGRAVPWALRGAPFAEATIASMDPNDGDHIRSIWSADGEGPIFDSAAQCAILNMAGKYAIIEAAEAAEGTMAGGGAGDGGMGSGVGGMGNVGDVGGVGGMGNDGGTDREATSLNECAGGGHSFRGEMPRDSYGTALRPQKGNAVTFSPIAIKNARDYGGIVIKDQTMLLDKVHQCCPCLQGLLFNLNLVAISLTLLLAPLSPFFSLFAIVSFTGTWDAFFGAGGGNNHTNGSSNGSSAIESFGDWSNNTHPLLPAEGATTWAPGLDETSKVLLVVFYSALLYIMTLNLVSLAHPGMVRILCRENWPNMLVVLGTSWTYGILAAYLLTNPYHVMYLTLVKFALPLYLTLFDAVPAGVLLRYRKETLEHVWGIDHNNDGHRTNSKVVFFALLIIGVALLLDIFRTVTATPDTSTSSAPQHHPCCCFHNFSPLDHTMLCPPTHI